MKARVAAAALKVGPGITAEAWKAVLREQAARAAVEGASLLALPEWLWLPEFRGHDRNNVILSEAKNLDPYSGSCPRKFDAEADALTGAWLTFFSRVAKDFEIYLLAGALPEYSAGAVYHTACLFDRNGLIAGKQRKLQLGAEEKQLGFSPGDDLRALDTEFGRVGILVGDDSRCPEYARILRLMGADVLLNPYSPMWEQTDLEDYHGCRVRCQENQTFGIQSGLAGEFAGHAFFGRSGVFAPTGMTERRDGRLAASSPGESQCAATLDFKVLLNLRNKFDLVKNLNLEVLRKYAEYLT